MSSTMCQEGENYNSPWKGETGTTLFLNKDFLLFLFICTNPKHFSGVSMESFVKRGEHTLTETSWQCFILPDTSFSRENHPDNL